MGFVRVFSEKSRFFKAARVFLDPSQAAAGQELESQF
jgi:hypothetical protein